MTSFCTAGSGYEGYEQVSSAVVEESTAVTSDISISADSPSRWKKWKSRDVKRDLGCMFAIVALLWISAMPMRRSHERALRGLVCLGLVVLSSLVIGWAVRSLARAENRAPASTSAQDEL